MNFASIRLEGSILTADVLDAIAREEKHFQKPSDFGLDPSTKVKDEIASTWASAKALWTGYQSRITNLREGQTGVSETRNLFVLPLLSLLGYQPEKTDAETVNAKSYAISHRDISRDGFPLHIMGWHDSLDKKRVSGGPRISSHALVQEYLNLTEHLYGLITNGRLLRLLRDSSRLIKLSFLEFDLMRIFEEDLYADFAILFRLLHASRMPANRVSASGSVIEKYHQDSVDSGSRIRDGLAAAVAYSMQTVANGLLAHPANANLVDELREHPARADELHQDLLRWVYRTLFLLVIEERGLNHAPEATLRQRRFYRDFYSLQRLRRLADRPQLADRRAHDLWRSMHQTLRLYEAGGKGLPLGVAPLGSFLFREEGLQNLFQYQLDNRSFLQALNRLSTFTHPDTKVRVRVNYGALDVEEFGSVYESLLELRPRIIPDGEKLTFNYAHLTGNERKTTGSYYTPDSLVQCLLDSALDPVVDERLKGKTGGEAEKALLSIKVCDPAVGSGHFLIGAAHRLAQRLADIRAGEEALSPDVQRHALRDVVNRCLYGVDVNPLSGELCKVSLWMLAMEPGKPLGFLDHHIQCGNSLLGVTPRLLNEGIPDDAFKPIAGDDKKYCSDFKKENKKEARDVHKRRQGVLFDREDRPWEHLGNLAAHLVQLSDLPDETPEQIHAKEKRYAELVHSSSYKSGHLLADAWCAAFVWKKYKPAEGGFDYPITNDIFWKLERNPHSIPSWMRDEIQRLREQYQFFHWHLAFPDVFPLPGKGEPPENKDAGWNGGFDVMLGNPPWERTSFEEVPYFSTRIPDIARAETTALRQQLIARLPESNPSVWEEYQYDLRLAEGSEHLFGDSGRFPYSASGRTNTFALFAELALSVASRSGYVGAVIPTALATDTPYAAFWSSIIDDRTVVSMFDFENRGIFFPNVHSSYKFSLFTFRPSRFPEVRSQFGFYLTSADEIRQPLQIFELSQDVVARMNPDTKLLPVCRTVGDFALLAKIHSHAALLSESAAPWVGLTSSATSGVWSLNEEEHAAELPAASFWEAKCIHQFNHRFSTYRGTSKGEKLDGNPHYFSEHKNPEASIITRYLVPANLCKKHFAQRQGYLSGACGYRDVARATDERTMIAAIVPFSGFMQPLNGISHSSPSEMLCLLGCLNSFVLDFACRQKTPGTHVNVTICKQLPTLPNQTYAEPCAWAGQSTTPLRDWLLPRVLELTYTAWDLESFARDCGWFGPPFVWDEARRFQLRCELDAAFFHLYGLSRADSAYILDTFPIVRRKDIAASEVKDAAGTVIQHGTYRTKDAIFALYDQLTECAAEGIAFASPLDPPPGDIAACHSSRQVAIPEPTWMDRPLVLPSLPRVALEPARYRSELVPHLLYQAGGKVAFERFRRAYWLITEPKLLQRFARGEIGDVAQQWGRTYCDKLQKEEFLAHLKSAVKHQLHFIRVEGERWLELRQFSVADDPHVVFDAQIALLSADLWPADEPIKPLTPSEEEALKELELVS